MRGSHISDRESHESAQEHVQVIFHKIYQIKPAFCTLLVFYANLSTFPLSCEK